MSADADIDVLAASFVGLRHVHHGVGREDAYAVARCALPGSVLLAVADGVGGSRDSHIASSLAVDMTRHAFASVPADALRRVTTTGEAWADHVDRLLGSIASEIETRLASQAGSSDSDARLAAPSTTLSIAFLVRAGAGGEMRIFWAAVGDSPIVVAEGEQAILSVVWDPPHDRTVDSLPLQPERRHVGIERVVDARAVLVLSDGMADVLLSRSVNHHQLIATVTGPMLSPPTLELLMQEMSGCHDDRTLVLATMRNP